MANEKNERILPRSEADSISRVLLLWLNQWPDKPVSTININYLKDGEPSMSLASPQGTRMLASYLRGAYQAQYSFKVIYRVQPGNSNNNRLKAMETLEAFARWIESQRPLPVFSDGKRAIKFNRNQTDPNAEFFNRYENGDEDYQILMTLDYSSTK